MLAAGSAGAVTPTGAKRTEDSITGFTEQQFLQQVPFGDGTDAGSVSLYSSRHSITVLTRSTDVPSENTRK